MTSTGSRSGHGCLKAAGIGCLIVVLLLGAAIGGGIWFVRRQVRTVLERFEREGYTLVQGDQITVTSVVTNPTIFVAQSVQIKKGSERGLAFLCQVAEIEGEVKGNVHFMGQVLTVQRRAVLDKDLDVKAQIVNLHGEVKGQITGVYQALNRPAK